MEYTRPFVFNLEDKVRKFAILNFISLNVYMGSSYFQKDKVLTAAAFIVDVRPQSPDFELLVTLWMCPCVIQPIVTYAVEMVTQLPLCWVTGEFDRLSQSMADIIKKVSPESEMSPAEMKDIEISMKDWVMHHQKVLRYFELVSELITIPKTFDLGINFSNAIVLAYRITTENLSTPYRIAAAGYFFPFLVYMKIGCTVGDILIDRSEKVLVEPLGEDWGALPLKCQKMILLVQQQTMKPSTIMVFKLFPVNTATFSQVMNMAYSVANLLIARRTAGLDD